MPRGGLLSTNDFGPLRELRKVLQARNGWYAFESALHLRGTCAVGAEPALEEWNSKKGWRTGYGEAAEGCFFFAADAFGGQFCVSGEAVEKFDPETGMREHLASNLEGWASVILDDFEAQTGWPLLRQWQEVYGAIVPGRRLVPVTPFVLGGEYAVRNLRAVPSEEAMRFYGDLAMQLRDLPDGARVKLRVID